MGTFHTVKMLDLVGMKEIHILCMPPCLNTHVMLILAVGLVGPRHDVSAVLPGLPQGRPGWGAQGKGGGRHGVAPKRVQPSLLPPPGSPAPPCRSGLALALWEATDPQPQAGLRPRVLEACSLCAGDSRGTADSATPDHACQPLNPFENGTGVRSCRDPN